MRETLGELLVRLVLSYVGNALPVKRFWSNDLTRGAIVNALKGLKDDAEYDPVYQAALVRQHADYQFGMNVTGTATLKLGDLYKLGRVKAPIIKMIVDREREIENFVQKSTWKRMFTYEDCEFVNGQEFQSREEALAQMPAADFAAVPPGAVVSVRREPWGVEALVKKREINPAFVTEHTTLEDIIIFWSKGGGAQ